MAKPFGYETLESYADAKRIPITAAIELVQNGKVAAKQVDGDWFVNEEEFAGLSSGYPGIVSLLNIAAIAVIVAAAVLSFVSWPDGYNIPGTAYIIPCAVFAAGVLSSLTLLAMAKGLDLLHIYKDVDAQRGVTIRCSRCAKAHG